MGRDSDNDGRFSDRSRSRRRRDDDDDDRGERSGAGDSGAKSALGIIGIIGAVILGIVLVCGGVGAFAVYMVVRAADKARQDVQKQLQQVIDEDMRRQREMKGLPPLPAPQQPQPK
ncbi:MAG TPA: hypothetical protein VFE62_09060 [Gemmataceae bacterium]|nr:hypothetical protein [Gemmataceae bacterium]